MRAYFAAVIGTATVILGLHFAIVLLVPAPIASEYWVNELISVKEELARRIAPHKIVFMGGSSVLFGIDAKKVGTALGQPAFNMGLHADMRLDQLLDIAQSVVKPGDTVILQLEHGYYDCNQDIYSDWQMRSMVSWDRPYFETLPLLRKLLAVSTGSTPSLSFEIAWTRTLMSLFPQKFHDRIMAMLPASRLYQEYLSGRMRTPDFRYSAFNIDDVGDIQNSRGDHFYGVTLPPTEPSSICPATANELRDFLLAMRAKRIRVLIANQPYIVERSSPALAWKGAENRFEKAVRSTGAELLDRREELFFGRSLFFDTNAHLNEDGRCLRTAVLIKDLHAAGFEIQQTDHLDCYRNIR